MRTLTITLVTLFSLSAASLAAPLNPASGTPAENEAQEEAAKLYQQAWNHYLAENLDEAEAGFRNLMERYRKSRWVDDSEYWLCGIQVKREGDTPAAFECYESFVQRHRRTSYRDDAEAQMITIGHSLARQGMDEYAEKVAAMREGQDEELALMAISALEDIGDDESLQAVLEIYRRSQREDLRERVARVLEDFRSEQATQALMEIVRNDASHKVRQRALRSLGEREGEMSVVPFLKEVASDTSQPHENRAYAVRSIGELAAEAELDFLTQTAIRTDQEVIGRAALGAIGDVRDERGFNALRQIFDQAALSETRRRALLVAGDDFPPEMVIDFLKELVLSNGDNEVRKTALAAIADMDYELAFPFVQEMALHSANPELRETAVRMLDEFKTEDSMLTLVQILAQDRSHATRMRAARGLSEFEDARSVEALKQAAINDAHTAVRRAAVSSLGEIGTPQAKQALVEILNRDQ